MESTQNVVVVIRIAGNVLACVRDGEVLRIRAVAKSTSKPADQSAALALLRCPEHSGGLRLDAALVAQGEQEQGCVGAW